MNSTQFSPFYKLLQLIEYFLAKYAYQSLEVFLHILESGENLLFTFFHISTHRGPRYGGNVEIDFCLGQRNSVVRFRSWPNVIFYKYFYMIFVYFYMIFNLRGRAFPTSCILESTNT